MSEYNLNPNSKFIFITGGVVSSLGKGLASASLAAILQARGYKVRLRKLDPYLNVDPGTMNPCQHGEVFVTDDGTEADLDLGHYERFSGVPAKRTDSVTTGKIYSRVIEKERHGYYLGSTIQVIPHVTNEIKDFILSDITDEDFVLCEIGGTVGDLENQFFIEAARQLSHEVGNENCMYVHLTYVPIPSGVKEQKSKPTQMSVRELNERGIYPDIIIARCEEFLKPHIKEKIGLFCNLPASHVISGVDVKHVYECPLVYDKEGIPEILLKKLRIYAPPKLDTWSRLVDTMNRNDSNPRKILNVAIGGKYTRLEDSYASIVESLNHAAAHLDVHVEIRWIDTEKLEQHPEEVEADMQGIDAVIIPGGFGTRGIEGKIVLIQYVREHNIPFLGICYGMQLAVVEFARHVCGMKDAGTMETESSKHHVKDPVIAYLPGQDKIKEMGATMRLGGHDVMIRKDSLAEKVYGATEIRERFRHRYEVNPQYVEQLEKGGLVFSGKAKNEDIMQIMEIPGHPYFMACQFHPELKSSLLHPAPLFLGLLKAADERA